ncbi:MAG: hypothetical protein ACK55I_08060 [bacterium]
MHPGGHAPGVEPGQVDHRATWVRAVLCVIIEFLRVPRRKQGIGLVGQRILGERSST